MEAAAIAWSCSLFSVPCFCVKAITDIVDGDRPAQVCGGPTMPLPARMQAVCVCVPVCAGGGCPTSVTQPMPASQEEFLQNLATAAAALQETLPNVIDFVSGKWYHEL